MQFNDFFFFVFKVMKNVLKNFYLINSRSLFFQHLMNFLINETVFFSTGSTSLQGGIAFVEMLQVECDKIFFFSFENCVHLFQNYFKGP